MTLDTFHQKCLTRLLSIRWHDIVQNDEVMQWTGVSHLPSTRRTSLFGHVARLFVSIPANKAVQLSVSASLSRLYMASPTWPSSEQVARPTPRWFCPFHSRTVEAVDTVLQRLDDRRWLCDYDDDDDVMWRIWVWSCAVSTSGWKTEKLVTLIVSCLSVMLLYCGPTVGWIKCTHYPPSLK